MEAKHSKFTLPFTIECSECHMLLLKGKKVPSLKNIAGSFFSSSIYEVVLDCPTCSSPMSLKNNPELSKFEVAAGCSKHTELTYLRANHQSEVLRINSIIKNNEMWRNDYHLNQTVRNKKRVENSEKSKKNVLIYKNIFNM